MRDLLDGSEVSALREEMAEWKENIEEHFAQTSKYEEVSECADALENVADEFESNLERLVVLLEASEAGKALLDTTSVKIPRRKGTSRSGRLGDVTLSVATALTEIEKAGLSHEDSEIAGLLEEIGGQNDELVGIDFPGMY